MKTMLFVLCFLCTLCARAEDWGMRYEYTDPSERNWFGNLMPIGDEMPFYFREVQTRLIQFRGSEFWPEWWGLDFHAEKRSRYGPVITIRGCEGMLICPGISFLSPATNESLPIKPGIGFDLTVRWKIGRFRK